MIGDNIVDEIVDDIVDDIVDEIVDEIVDSIVDDPVCSIVCCPGSISLPVAIGSADHCQSSLIVSIIDVFITSDTMSGCLESNCIL